METNSIYNNGSTPIPKTIAMQVGPTSQKMVATSTKATGAYGLSDSGREIGPVDQKEFKGLMDYTKYGMTPDAGKVGQPDASVDGADASTSRC